MTYTVVLLREEDGRYSVYVPALRGCNTWGETLPHALRMAEEAMRLHAESLQVRGQSLPPDVSKVEVDLADATEAVIYKIALTEAAQVA